MDQKHNFKSCIGTVLTQNLIDLFLTDLLEYFCSMSDAGYRFWSVYSDSEEVYLKCVDEGMGSTDSSMASSSLVKLQQEVLLLQDLQARNSPTNCLKNIIQGKHTEQFDLRLILTLTNGHVFSYMHAFAAEDKRG